MNKLTPLFVLLGLASLGCEPTGNTGNSGSPPPPRPSHSLQLENSPPPRSSGDVLADAPMFDSSGEPDGTRNFYFVLDGSGSMNDACSGKKKIDQLKRAVEKFMVNVPSEANIGAYVFDTHGAREVVALGPNNHDRFLKAVREMDGNDRTPLGSSIAFGSKQLEAQYKRQQGYGEFRLIVVTDGDATDDLEQGLRVADARHIPIYTIGFCLQARHSLSERSASYVDATSEAELKAALSKTVAELDMFDPTVFDEKIVDRVMN